MHPQQEANEANIYPVQEWHITIVYIYIFLLYKRGLLCRRGLLVRRGRLAGGAGSAQLAQPIKKKYICIYNESGHSMVLSAGGASSRVE